MARISSRVPSGEVWNTHDAPADRSTWGRARTRVALVEEPVEGGVGAAGARQARPGHAEAQASEHREPEHAPPGPAQASPHRQASVVHGRIVARRVAPDHHAGPPVGGLVAPRSERAHSAA